MRVIVCLDGQRRIVAERDGSVTIYTLYEPLEVGRFGSVREVDGRLMGRADSRRAATVPTDYDAALAFELGQRRRAEDQILANCPELQARDAQRGGLLGVYRARGRVKFIGSAEASRSLALAQRRRRAAPQSTNNSAMRAAS